jgi:hypothetical protein
VSCAAGCIGLAQDDPAVARGHVWVALPPANTGPAGNQEELGFLCIPAGCSHRNCLVSLRKRLLKKKKNLLAASTGPRISLTKVL